MRNLLCLSFIAGVFSGVIKKPIVVDGIVGRDVSFATKVQTKGSLTYKGAPVGDVKNSKFIPDDEWFKDRLQWDSSTGFFSITRLKMEDSGEYRVSDDANQETVYNLTVYVGNVPVSKPKVSYNKTSCTICCTVERGTGVTLSWYKEGKKESFVSSHSHNAQTKVDQSGTYTCKTVNSVSNQTASVIVGEECSGGAAVNWQTGGSKIWIMCLAVMVTSHSFLL